MKTFWLPRGAVLSFLTLFCSAGFLYAQAGALDLDFTPQFPKMSQPYVEEPYAHTVVVQADGKILVSGSLLTRFNSDGTPGPGFQSGLSGGQAPGSISVEANGQIVVAGGFVTTTPNGVLNGLARLNPDGSVDATFAPAPSSFMVEAAVAQPDGKIVAAGYDTATAGGAREYTELRFNVDGSRDQTFNATVGAVDEAMTLALQPDGKILASGFAHASNSVGFLFRMNVDGSSDATFVPVADGPLIDAIVVQSDGKIIVGGPGTASSSAVSAGYLSRLNPDGTRDASFYTQIYVGGAVTGLALQCDGKILLCGTFQDVNNFVTPYLARLSPDGQLDHTFVGGTNNAVLSEALLADGEVIIGGIFSMVDGVARAPLARLSNGLALANLRVTNSTTIDWQRGGTAPEVEAVTFELSTDGGSTWNLLGNGTRVTGGWELTGLTLPGTGLLRARGDTGHAWVEQVQSVLSNGVDPEFHPAVAGSGVTATAVQGDGRILLGGSFSSVDGVAFPGIARLNPDGNVDGTFNPGPGTDGTVSRLSVQPDGKVLVAGSFSTVHGVARHLLARLAANGSLDASFNPADRLSGTCTCLTLQPDGNILVAGGVLVDGVTIGQVVRLKPDGTPDWGFKAAIDASHIIEATLVQADGKILAGGYMTNPYGSPPLPLVRLAADGSVDAGFRPGVSTGDSIFNIVEQPDGKILLGGNFSVSEAGPTLGLLRLNADGSRDTGFEFPGGLGGALNSLALQADGKVLIGGAFGSLGGITTHDLGRLNADGSVDATFETDFDPASIGAGAGPIVSSIAVEADGGILAAGPFLQTVGGSGRSFVRLGNPTASQVLANATTTMVQWLRGGTAPEVSFVTFDFSTDGGLFWSQLGNGVRIPGGWEHDGLPLPISGLIRARGMTLSGAGGGSGGFVEQIHSFSYATLSLVSITSTNANPRLAKAGDTLALSFTTTEPLDTPLVTICGQLAKAVQGSGNTWTARVDVTSDFPQGAVAFSISVNQVGGPPGRPVTATTDGSVVIIDTAPPTVNTAAVPAFGYEEGMTLPNFLGLVVASDANGPVALVQSPAAGTVLGSEAFSLTFTATDAAGNTAQAALAISPAPAAPTNTAVVSRGQPVTGQLTGSYAGFGVPELGAFGGFVGTGKARQPAVFGRDGSVLLGPQSIVEGLPFSFFSSFSDPSGDAVVATLRSEYLRAVRPEEKFALLTGLQSGALRVVVQSGTQLETLPYRVAVARFLAIDGNGSTTFFRASLSGLGVTPGNSTALLAAGEDGAVHLLVRTGQQVGQKTVKSLATLAGSAGTLADGRWRLDDARIGVRLTYADASEELWIIPAAAQSTADWTSVARTGPVEATALPGLPAGAKIVSFGLPGFGAQGTAVLAQFTLPNRTSGTALLAGLGTPAPHVLARKGDSPGLDANGAPLPGAVISGFSDPVVNERGGVALLVALKAPGQAPGVSSGILYAPDGTTATLLANNGAQTPEGRYWAGFKSLVLPNTPFGGPLFVATLSASPFDVEGRAETSSLWGVDATGNLQLLLQTGACVRVSGVEKTVAGFTALTASSQSLGAASGYDDAGNVAAIVTFADRSESSLDILAP